VSNWRGQDLFIIGASNRPDLIDPALLRPGRFDKLLYVGVSSDATYRERVLAALTRKFTLDKNVSLVGIARRCPVNFTGADMYALCADAWLQATKRKVAQRDKFTGSSDIKEADDNIVVVKQDDFFKALGELTPSLSRAELDRYERLRIQFEGQGTRSASSSA
jgi:peroxin-6